MLRVLLLLRVFPIGPFRGQNGGKHDHGAEGKRGAEAPVAMICRTVQKPGAMQKNVHHDDCREDERDPEMHLAPIVTGKAQDGCRPAAVSEAKSENQSCAQGNAPREEGEEVDDFKEGDAFHASSSHGLGLAI